MAARTPGIEANLARLAIFKCQGDIDITLDEFDAQEAFWNAQSLPVAKKVFYPALLREAKRRSEIAFKLREEVYRDNDQARSQGVSFTERRSVTQAKIRLAEKLGQQATAKFDLDRIDPEDVLGMRRIGLDNFIRINFEKYVC